MITNRKYVSQARGSTFDEIVDIVKAHGIIEVPFIDAPNFTLAHELGHLFQPTIREINNHFQLIFQRIVHLHIKSQQQNIQ